MRPVPDQLAYEAIQETRLPQWFVVLFFELLFVILDNDRRLMKGWNVQDFDRDGERCA